ncbi:MAG: GNAT family N-acetyltransferase [Clostridiaceae bacterium]|nr:GNAT family N-acetyltransferase [Clostridiaceae bacterium]
MKIKEIGRKELDKALPLVWDVFCKFEAVDYPENGRQAFRDAIHDEEYLDSLKAYGAFEGKELLGIIATSKNGSHVALFFVDGNHHGKGIGRQLWNRVLADNNCEVIDVHSSVFAVPIYEKLDFVRTDGVKEENGIRYVPMEYRTEIKENCPCKKSNCIRHGHCNECRAHHEKSGRERPCEKTE